VSLIENARLVTPDGIVDGWLETAGSTISGVGSGEPPKPTDRDLGGRWVVPGFVDIHVHGGAGADFLSSDHGAARQAIDVHRRHGTTTMLASLVTADLETLVTTVGSLADLADNGMLAGIHLEGPFLAPERAGAHDRSQLTAPAPDLVDRLIAAGRGAIRMVTLAPELLNALDAVHRLVGAGIAVAVGHTDATYDQTRAALDAGATVGTHLFNAMRPLRQREPGPAAALLEDDRVTVELICDGVHLHPAIVGMAIRNAGPSRVALVTDAIAAAGAGDGEYRLGEFTVRVRDGIARLADEQTLAGSALTMDRAFRFAVETGASVEDAVRMSSTTPARVLGLADRLGSIAVGNDADLVVLDDTFHTEAVMAKGSWLGLDG
jgi:N-acetylglucosamine-6-phosphate deacetylase